MLTAMENEIAMRRGVKFWWLFCLLYSCTGLLTMAPRLTTTVISITLSGILYTRSISLAIKPPGRLTARPLANIAAIGQGLLLFGTTALILPCWSPLTKVLAIISTILLIAQAGLRLNTDSSKIWRFVQTLSHLLGYVVKPLPAARAIESQVMRYPAIALAYVLWHTTASAIWTWVVVYDLPYSDLPRIRLLLRHFRLRYVSWCSRFQNKHADVYKHSPIIQSKEEANTIRLLKVLKRRPFGDIRCQLVQVRTDDRPDYEALSYTWGQGKMTEAIHIDGKIWLVAPTVLAALYHLCSYTRDRFLWIDSICIDQTNHVEKSHQIGLMRQIYHDATTVIVWLDGIEEPWKVRTMLAGLWHEYTYGTVESCLALIRRYSEVVPEAGWIQLSDMYANPWFSRIWVAQEVAMASSVTVLAGGETLGWEHIATVAQMLGKVPFNMALQASHMPGVKDDFMTGILHAAIMAHFNVERDYRNLDLASLIGLTSNFLATEPVDRIYALLGLLKPDDSSQAWLEPDYSKSAVDVYTYVAQHLIVESCNDILSCAGIGYDRALNHLPSWVPDWTRQSTRQTFRQHFAKTQRSAQYNASAGSRLAVSFNRAENKVNGQDQHHMEIKGHRCGRIVHIGKAMTYTEHNGGEGDTPAVMGSILEAHMLARRLAKRFARDPYPTGQTMDEAFWRCLLGDTQFQRPAPAALGVCCLFWEALTLGQGEMSEAVKEQVREEIDEVAATGLPGEAGWTEDMIRCAYLWNSHRIMCCTGRALAVTDAGYLAMVPPGTIIGDWLCLLYGLNTPFMLRPVAEGVEGFGVLTRLVGEAYVHGMMDGEAMWADVTVDTFNIV